MKDVFLRELRESIKWSAVIAAALLFQILNQLRNPSPFILFELSQNFMVIFAPLAGLLMGAVQSLFETRADNWAFAVHRPVLRRAIFTAKCAAGLLALYAALAVPTLVVTGWAARPGHLSVPFQARMVLPLVSDFLVAGCYYFAAIVLVLRRARWFGTRILPIGLALAISALVNMFIVEFWQALVLILAGQALGALAAWGVYAANGTADISTAPRLALGAMIFPGAMAAAIGLSGFAQVFLPAGHQWHYYQVDRDGVPVVTTFTIENGERRVSLFTDPAGRTLTQYEDLDLDDPANANVFLRFNARLWDDRAIPWPMDKFAGMDYRSSFPGVVTLSAVAAPNIRLRFSALYNVPERLIELYDPISHAHLGWVGPDGFTAGDPPPARRFPEMLLNSMGQRGRRVLPFAGIAYWIELDQRRVRPLFTAPADDPINSAAQIGTPADPLLVVATRKRLHLLRPTGEELFSAALPADSFDRVFQPALLANGHLVLQAWVSPTVTKFKLPQLIEYGPDGTVLHTTDLPVLPQPRGPKPYETVMFATSFPLAARPFCPSWILDEVLDIRATAYAGLFEGAMIIAAIASGILTLLIARRYALGVRRTCVWTLANILLGPAGVIVLLSLFEKPARERCVLCGNPRLITHRLCPRCHGALPPPPTDGTEIFEPQGESLLSA